MPFPRGRGYFCCSDMVALLDRLQLVFDWYQGMADPLTGRFVYLYHPERDSQVVDGSPIRDIGAVWDVEVLGAFLGRAELRPATERALDWLLALIMERAGSAVVAPTDEEATIAHNAFMLLALARSTRGDRVQRIVPLAEAILLQQRRDGSYRVSFSSETDLGEDFHPADEAMLALLEAYRLTGDDRFLASVERGFRLHRLDYYDTGSVEPDSLVFFANWQSQAGRLLFDLTAEADTRCIENGIVRPEQPPGAETGAQPWPGTT